MDPPMTNEYVNYQVGRDDNNIVEEWVSTELHKQSATAIGTDAQETCWLYKPQKASVGGNAVKVVPNFPPY